MASSEVRIQTVTPTQTQPIPSETPPPPLVSTDTINSNPTRNTNCTYTAIYWLASPDSWPAQNSIGNLNYTQEQAIEFVKASPVEVFNVLFIQFQAAYLNMLSGASQSQIIDAMIEASNWLSKYLETNNSSDIERLRGLDLAKALQVYNDGKIGPGSCTSEPISLDLPDNNFLAAALSLTPDVSVNVATATSDLTLTTGTPGPNTPAPRRIYSFPTATRTPPRRPNPGATLKPPTLIPTPQPTSTRVPPTARPTTPPSTATHQPSEPTPTSAPPEEPTPTSPPP